MGYIGLSADLCMTAGKIRRHGYSAVSVEPKVSYSSTPTIDGAYRIHNLFYPDSTVAIMADGEKLLERKVTNPKWIPRMLKEDPLYPLSLLIASLTLPYTTICLILQERYEFSDNFQERQTATMKLAQKISERLKKHGVKIELSDLVTEVSFTQGGKYIDIFPDNPEIRRL